MKKFLLIVVALAFVGSAHGQNEAALRARVAELEAKVRELEAALKAANARPAAVPARGWRELASWKGSGAKSTESFQTKSSEWRIRWKVTREVVAGASIFQIMVHNSSGKLVSLAANKQGLGADTSFVRGAPGKYYLVMNAASADWEVVVEEQ